MEKKEEVFIEGGIMSLISRVKSKGKEVSLSSKDTAKTMLEKDA